MVNYIQVVVAMTIGFASAALNLAALWWTVRHLITARYRGSLFLFSLIIRTAFVVAIFFAVLTQCGWTQLAISLASFGLTRFLIVGIIARSDGVLTGTSG